MTRSDRALVADVLASDRMAEELSAPCAGCRKPIPEGQAIQWRRVGGSFRWHRECLPADVQARLAADGL